MQQINLLTEDIVEKRELLNTHQVLVGWGGFAVLLILLSGIDGWQGSRLERQVATSQQQYQQLEQAVIQLEQEMAGGVANLNAQIEDLREQHRAQSAMAVTLAAQQRQQGLSRAMVGLARSSLDGLWLSEIHILPHGLHLKGQATDAVLLPRYIQALSEQERFAGHSFEAVTLLLDDESETLSFELRAPDLDGSGL